MRVFIFQAVALRVVFGLSIRLSTNVNPRRVSIIERREREKASTR